MLALPRPPLLVRRMTALLRARLPRSTDFGKAEPSRRCTQEPARPARRAPDNGDFIGIKPYLSRLQEIRMCESARQSFRHVQS